MDKLVFDIVENYKNNERAPKLTASMLHKTTGIAHRKCEQAILAARYLKFCSDGFDISPGSKVDPIILQNFLDSPKTRFDNIDALYGSRFLHNYRAVHQFVQSRFAMYNSINKLAHRRPRSVLVIGDTQHRQGVPDEHFTWFGHEIIERRPDLVMHMGDHYDIPSMGKYDIGTLIGEGARYCDDLEAAYNALKILSDMLDSYVAANPDYFFDRVITIGNHENRLLTFLNENPRFQGTLGLGDMKFEELGWDAIPFLDLFEQDGLTYAHYFAAQQSGRAIGGEAAMTRMQKLCFSGICGHQQMYINGVKPLINGKRIRHLVAGNSYLHDEGYRGPQCNTDKRCIFSLTNVRDGDYDVQDISMEYLCRKYEDMPLWKFMKLKHPKTFRNSRALTRQASL